MKQGKYQLTEKNAVIAALFIFQYSILIPLMNYVSSSVLVGISGIALFLAAFAINRKIEIDLRTGIVLVVLTIAFLLKTLFTKTEVSILVEFLMIAVPPVLIFSYSFCPKTFLTCSYKLAFINFAVLCLTPFIGPKVAYMRFGYGMLLTVIFIYLQLFHKDASGNRAYFVLNFKRRKLLLWPVFIASALEMVIFGSRGALLAFVVFVLIHRFLISRKNAAWKLLLFGLLILLVLNLEYIVGLLISIAEDLGVQSYALRKYEYQLKFGLEEASSGRAGLYESALLSIKEYPFFGAPLVKYEDGTMYAHNLFLQVGRDFGVFALVLCAIFVAYCIYLMFAKKVKQDTKLIISAVFCISVMRLMVSSNVWERPEFWVLLCIVFRYKTLPSPRGVSVAK